MANTPTARKRVRQTARRTATNRARLSRIRTFTKKVETALAAGDVTSAREALRRAEPEIARGVTKGVLHKNSAARKISRLSQRVKKLQATA